MNEYFKVGLLPWYIRAAASVSEQAPYLLNDGSPRPFKKKPVDDKKRKARKKAKAARKARKR